jgi:type I restriction enzyme S subunit
MGKIQTVPLNEVCEIIQYGYTASAVKEPVGPKFVRITDIVPDAIDWAEVPYCQIEESKKEKYVLKSGDIVIARTGATTGYAKYLKNPPPSIFASYLVRVRVKGGVDPRYIGFVVQSDTYKRFIKTNMGGSAQPNANAKVLTSFPVPLPSFLSQRKIAAILSAYDDLIENNLRRIKILEEMAQSLYREWFVKFRFPGHQKVKTVNSALGKIPEGWEVGILNDVLATLESGSRPKGGIDPEARGVPSIGAENIIGLGRYDYSKEKFVTREFFNKMNRGHVQSGDVLLYKDGAQIGRKSMFRDGFPHAECCINEHAFILRTNGRCSQNYLFFWLDQPEMTQNIINLNANAAQPGINQSGVRGLRILLPPAPLLEIAEEVLEPLLGALFKNAKRNNILRQTRDLLLPKLISGEMDVSELDITISEANA